jgi:hypothetical protein
MVGSQGSPLSLLYKGCVNSVCPTQLPHHLTSEPAFRRLVEDVLGQTGNQLRSFRETFEKVLPPPSAQVSVSLSPPQRCPVPHLPVGKVNPRLSISQYFCYSRKCVFFLSLSLSLIWGWMGGTAMRTPAVHGQQSILSFHQE